jgi:hypothetical protein
MPEQRLLPIRPRPLPDELCSSWLLRLAAESGITLRTLRGLISPRIRVPAYDCDRAFGVHQLRPIAEATGTDVEVVRSTLLRFDEVFEQGIGWPETWLLPVGDDTYTKERVGYQYCPVCLATGVPYFRKRWRFSLFMACTEHERQLVDECKRCGAQIHGFAIGLAGLEKILAPNGEAPFLRCVACGWDLRDVATHEDHLSEEILPLQRLHEQLLAASLRREVDGSDYFWMLDHAVQLFAKDVGTIPYAYLKARYRGQVLERANWLLQDERWRYIQSLRTEARRAIMLSTAGEALRKPVTREQLPAPAHPGICRF